MGEYLIQPGDTLGKVAARQLGDVERWRELAELNQLSRPYLIFVGQKLQLPTGKAPSSLALLSTAPAQPSDEIPATLALARGSLFVLFEQLPEVGTGRIVRKVAAVPRNFSMIPTNPGGTLTLADHVINLDRTSSPFLSASGRPFGAPTINGKPVLIDVVKTQAAGARIYTTAEIVTDLRRFLAANPRSQAQIERLIWAVTRVEGEMLIKGSVPREAISMPNRAVSPYVGSAEELWDAFRRRNISNVELEQQLAQLEGAYERARVVGRVGRVLTAVGVIVTVHDVAQAARTSVATKSMKPLGAEAVRQLGGWGGALAGSKIGFSVGALFGIETGPGAIATGALGAIVFGAMGYFGADLAADQIFPN